MIPVLSVEVSSINWSYSVTSVGEGDSSCLWKSLIDEHFSI